MREKLYMKFVCGSEKDSFEPQNSFFSKLAGLATEYICTYVGKKMHAKSVDCYCASIQKPLVDSAKCPQIYCIQEGKQEKNA